MNERKYAQLIWINEKIRQILYLLQILMMIYKSAYYLMSVTEVCRRGKLDFWGINFLRRNG